MDGRVSVGHALLSMDSLYLLVRKESLHIHKILRVQSLLLVLSVLSDGVWVVNRHG